MDTARSIIEFLDEEDLDLREVTENDARTMKNLLKAKWKEVQQD
jgi:hypothetical protein